MTSIAVLITCHNRVFKTLQCLDCLSNQIGINDSFFVDVFLVDDGSTDGTKEKTRQFFPEVRIIDGSGELFWNRGMHLAWKSARDSREYDFYLWLNDDTNLYSESLIKILETSNVLGDKAIICGTTCSLESGKVTYGGYLLSNHELMTPEIGFLNKCDYFNGNCVLVPQMVFEKLGNLNPYFRHAIGDFEYSLRARKNGIDAYLSPFFIGTCEQNQGIKQCWDHGVGVMQRIKFLYSPLSGCNPFEFFVYEKAYFGFLKALQHFVYFNLRAIFPRKYFNN